MKRHGKHTDLGEALEKELRRLDRKNGGAYATARVVLAWERIAGEGVARHTTGAYVRDDTLIVYVDSNTWATQYTAMAEQYRAAVNAELGENRVSAVRFTVSRRVQSDQRLKRVQTQTEEFYASDDVEPIPLTAVERAQLEASVAEIPDAGLREAVLKATVKDLEWKKGLAARNEAQGSSGSL